MHTEACPSDPSAVRWVIRDHRLPAGRLVDAPGRLGQLLHSDALAEVTTEPYGVVVRLAPGHSWRDHGDDVRAALTTGLDTEPDWVVAVDEDATLRRIVEDVLAGPDGDYVRGHGGSVTVVRVEDGIVDVAFDGACSHCPASGGTLHGLLEAAVRTRYPDLRELRDTTMRRSGDGRPRWARLSVTARGRR